jgi:RND family efflux transporter MFP subunit
MMFKNKFNFQKQKYGLCILFCLFIKVSVAAELDCMVKPEMYIELSSPIAGVLEKIWVNKGDHVAKGQVIAQLESSVEIAKAKQAKFEATNNSNITNRKAHLEFTLRNRGRLQDLYNRGSLSKGEQDKAETDAALAETELGKAIEQKKLAALELEVVSAQLKLKTIKSPIDGLVIDRYAMIGESVTDRAIMKLAQVNPLRVELVAPTEYFGLIKEGMQVEIRPERPANKVFQATVTIVDHLIDPASGSFSVRMSLPNPTDELIGGVNCVVMFKFESPPLSNSSQPSSTVPIENSIINGK